MHRRNAAMKGVEVEDDLEDVIKDDEEDEDEEDEE
jgi:hypothetical protein